MTYKLVRTDDGLEIQDDDGGLIAGPSQTEPVRDPDVLKDLFDNASIGQPMKDLLLILFGVKDVTDERDIE